MAFVRLAFFPGATLDHYASLADALAGAPVPRERLVFAAGPRDGGLQVVQVWESREALDAFNEAWLTPALARLGGSVFPAPPTVTDFETHDLSLSHR